jgi:hypothetical protein
MQNFDHLQRQWDVIPNNVLASKIDIVGAGAIGSFVALSLAKMGFGGITIRDFDSVSIENMNAQFFRFSDIGKPKVVALQSLIEDFTGQQISALNEKYTNQILNGIVISAVDSMEVRKTIWEKAKINPSVRLVIDPRMAAEQGLIYAMDPKDPKDVRSYEATLYSDNEAVQDRCTARSTMYCVLGIASMVCKIVKDLTTNCCYTRSAMLDVKANNYTTFVCATKP